MSSGIWDTCDKKWKGINSFVKSTLLSCSVNMTQFTSNLKLPHLQSFSSQIFMESNISSQHCRRNNYLKKEEKTTLHIFTPYSLLKVGKGLLVLVSYEECCGCFPLPNWPSQSKFVLLSNMHQPSDHWRSGFHSNLMSWSTSWSGQACSGICSHCGIEQLVLTVLCGRRK